MYGKDKPSRDDGSLRWLYIDMNSFFASVEQELNPRLRGKPVAVIPVQAETTVALAASYEAKAFGIKTGTSVRDARKLCPGIQFVLAEHGHYVEFHHKVEEAVGKILPIHAICSIDEFACSLMGSERKIENATRLAQEIKTQIYQDVGKHIHCSIGLAPNRYLAKVAADMKKPNGLTALFQQELPGALKDLALRDLPGIGEQTEKRLYRYGINSIEKLIAQSERELQAINGIWGERLWHWLRGEHVDLPATKRSTISHSHVLAPELRNPESARLVALKLLHKAASRLRKSEFWARRLSLHVRFQEDFAKFDETISIPECCDDVTMLEFFNTLWATIPQANPRKVAVVLSDLVPSRDHTLPLFSNPRREQFVRAMDQVQEKFGKKLIYFAGVSAIKGVAGPAIAFTNIPDMEAERDGFEGQKSAPSPALPGSKRRPPGRIRN